MVEQFQIEPILKHPHQFLYPLIRVQLDFQPPYFPPPFTSVSHHHHPHQHPFDQIQSNHPHNLDYTSSSPPFTGSSTSQSYNSLVRSSGVNIDETSAQLSHPYGAYAEYAASYYTRHAMVLDPESIQLYRSGLLAGDPTSTAAFRVDKKMSSLPIESMDLFFL